MIHPSSCAIVGSEFAPAARSVEEEILLIVGGLISEQEVVCGLVYHMFYKGICQLHIGHTVCGCLCR